MTAAHANLAGALVVLKRYDEAIAQYQTALKEVPGNRALELNLALAYFKQGDTASAAALLNSLHRAEPSDERVAILLADCDLRIGQDNDAVALLSPFAEADTENLDIDWALGSALIASGHQAEGVARVQKVADLGQSAPAYLLAAQTYLKLARFDLARQDIDAALRLNPHLPGINVVHGMVLDYFSDEHGAATAFEKAIQAKPNDFQAELRLGAVLYTQRKLIAAAKHLQRALELDPSSAPAHYELGRVERTEGHLQAAVTQLEAAARENPDWLAPHVELTALYYRLKRPADGAREKKIVDQLSALKQKRGAEQRTISPISP